MTTKTTRLTIGANDAEFGWACLKKEFEVLHRGESLMATKISFGTHSNSDQAENISFNIRRELLEIFSAWNGKAYLILSECVPSHDRVRLHKGLFYQENHIDGVVYEGKREAGEGLTAMAGVVEMGPSNVANIISRMNSFRGYVCLADPSLTLQEIVDATFDSIISESGDFCTLDFPEIVYRLSRPGGLVVRKIWGTNVDLVFYASREAELATLKLHNRTTGDTH